jgi:hypothetical protein
VQSAIKSVKADGAVGNPDGTLTAGPVLIAADEYSAKLAAADPEYTAALPDPAGLAVLDGTARPELEAEGFATTGSANCRSSENSSGLDVSDRISVVMVPEGADWASIHCDVMAREILATRLDFGEPSDGAEIGDGVRVAISKSLRCRSVTAMSPQPRYGGPVAPNTPREGPTPVGSISVDKVRLVTTRVIETPRCLGYSGEPAADEDVAAFFSVMSRPSTNFVRLPKRSQISGTREQERWAMLGGGLPFPASRSVDPSRSQIGG